jgi:elongation factor Ts
MESANLIKDLRNKTGAGFLDCKNALSETNNNLDEAIEYLRKKGLAKASKKSSREANEGAVGIYSNDKIITIIKVNSETDFAAKSDTFLNFIDQLGNLVIKNNNLNMNREDLMNLNFEDNSVSDYFKSMIAKIGENLVLNELLIFPNQNNNFSFYIHNSYRNNIGKIVSFILYKTDDNKEEIKNLSKNLCMHVAAMKPESIDIYDLDTKIIDNEKKIQKELILSSGKPEKIAEKILDGKMNKFYSEVTLLNQKYILDQEKSVKEIIKKFSDDYNYEITSFQIVTL